MSHTPSDTSRRPLTSRTLLSLTETIETRSSYSIEDHTSSETENELEIEYIVELVRKWLKEIECRFHNRDHEDSFQFASPSAAYDVFTEKRLLKLLQALKIGRSDADSISAIASLIRPPENYNAEKSHCNVLATLMRAGGSPEDLLTFVRTLSGEQEAIARTNLCDDKLPFTQEKAISVFGEQLGVEFSKHQLFFRPHIIVGGPEENSSKDRATGLVLRMPYILSSRARIGEGADSIVFRIQIAPGCWSKNGDTNSQPKWVAQKIVKERRRRWDEDEVTKSLSECGTTSKHIALPLAFIREDGQFSTLYDLSIMTLEELFQLYPSFFEAVWGLDTYQANNAKENYLKLDPNERKILASMPIEDMRKALTTHSDLAALRSVIATKAAETSPGGCLLNNRVASLVLDQLGRLCSHGLSNLHGGVLCDGQRSLCHTDIHPSNLQIHKDGWKLGDFSSSKWLPAKEPQIVMLSDAAALHGSPEAKLVGRGGLTSDFWSFGVILLFTTTWLVGGPDLVDRLDPILQRNEDEECCFLEHGDGRASLSPLVVDYMRKVHIAAISQDVTLADAVRDFLIDLREKVLVADWKQREEREKKAWRDRAESRERVAGGDTMSELIIKALQTLSEAIQKGTAAKEEFEPHGLNSRTSWRSSLFKTAGTLTEPLPVFRREMDVDSTLSHNVSKSWHISFNPDADIFECAIRDNSKTSDAHKVRLRNEWPLEHVFQTLDGKHVTFVTRHPMQSEVTRISQCAVQDLIDISSTQATMFAKQELLYMRLNNSKPGFQCTSLKKYLVSTQNKASFLGRDGQLLVFRKDQDPMILGWRDTERFGMELTSDVPNLLRSFQPSRVVDLIAVDSGNVAYIAWTHDGQILRIAKEGVTCYHPKLDISTVLISADRSHAIVVGRESGSVARTKSLKVWKTKVDKIGPQALFTEMGSLPLREAKTPPVLHGEVLPGRFYRPHNVRIWTSQSGGLQGSFF